MSQFNFHKESVTSVEWSPYESSMLATSGADNQVCLCARGGGGDEAVKQLIFGCHRKRLPALCISGLA